MPGIARARPEDGIGTPCPELLLAHRLMMIHVQIILT
jgi:hypothetical protein